MGTILYLVGFGLRRTGGARHLQEKHFDRRQGDRSVLVLLTSWVGLLVYYFYAKDHLEEWFK